MTERKRRERKDPGFRSSEFQTAGHSARYSLDNIPTAIWKPFRDLCVEREVSVRVALLRFIRNEVEAHALEAKPVKKRDRRRSQQEETTV